MAEQIIIRVFRAVDEPETCEKFYEGHTNVLRSYGIEPISSAKKEWFFNPEVYGLVALYNNRVVGGAKVHKVGGTQELPMEESMGYMDKRVYDLVAKYAKFGAGEGCGLWNAKEVAGRGLGYLLSRTMITFATEVGINRMFACSSDHTTPMFREFGFRVVRSIGDNGDFTYPTPEYKSRILLVNAKTLAGALPYNREIMMSLREKPNQRRTERGPKGELKIYYQLSLSNA